jgi:hypothetical protein
MHRKNLLLIYLPVFVVLKGFGQDYVTNPNYVKQITAERLPVPYKGKVLEAYEYRDDAGLHYYVATEEASDKSDSLFIACYTKIASGFARDWQMKDFSPYGVTYLTFTKIMDIDSDGIDEVISTYRVEGDILKKGILAFKLILHYKDKKYAIRNISHYGDDLGEVTMDKTFDTLPKSVRSYTVDLWNNEILKSFIVKPIK